MAFKVIKRDGAAPRDAKSRQAIDTLNRIAEDFQEAAAPVFREREQLDARSRELRQKKDEREGRSSEHLIAMAVLRLLAHEADGEASLEEIRADLPRYMSFTVADLVPLMSRGGEEAWIQQIRNIISHRDVPGNFIREGLLEYAGPARLRITNEGMAALAETKDAKPPQEANNNS